MLPKLCDKIRKIIKPWRDEAVPVLGWDQFLCRIKESYLGMDEDTLRAVTAYLHIMGDVSIHSTTTQCMCPCTRW